MRESLTTHFKQWTGDLLFLALFSNQPTASIVAKLLKGQDTARVTGEVFDMYHKKVINKERFVIFLNKNVQTNTIMKQRQLPLLRDNVDLFSLLSSGCIFWAEAAISVRLQQLRDIYLYQYSAMPSNTQFTERGVKESGYVSLGWRNETNWSVLDIARGRTLKEALKRGQEEIQPLLHAGAPILKKEKKLQGNIKCKVMMREVFKQHDKMKIIMADTIQRQNAIKKRAH